MKVFAAWIRCRHDFDDIMKTLHILSVGAPQALQYDGGHNMEYVCVLDYAVKNEFEALFSRGSFEEQCDIREVFDVDEVLYSPGNYVTETYPGRKTVIKTTPY